MKAFKLENEPKIKSGFKTIITLRIFQNLMHELPEKESKIISPQKKIK
jgi:hypothetical protein